MKKPLISEKAKNILEIIVVILLDAICILAAIFMNKTFKTIPYGTLYFSLLIAIAAFCTAALIMIVVFAIKKSKVQNTEEE